jgi:hypothetical protein
MINPDFVRPSVLAQAVQSTNNMNVSGAFKRSQVKYEANVRTSQQNIETGKYDPELLFQQKKYKPDIYDNVNWEQEVKLRDVDYEDQRQRNLDSKQYRYISRHYVDTDKIFNPETKKAYTKGVNPYNVSKPLIPVEGTKLRFPDSVLPNNDYKKFNEKQPNFDLMAYIPETQYTNTNKAQINLAGLIATPSMFVKQQVPIRAYSGRAIV